MTKCFKAIQQAEPINGPHCEVPNKKRKVLLCEIKGDCLEMTLKFKDRFIRAGSRGTYTIGVIPPPLLTNRIGLW